MSVHEPGAAGTGGSHDEEEGKGEPETPTWLTLLGVALFFLVMLLFLATRPEGKTAEELSRAAAPSAATGDAGPANP